MGLVYRVLLLAVVVAVAGCQVTTVVTVQMDQDGSGQVEVRLGLDEEALSHVPNLDGSGVGSDANLRALVRTDDLEAAGWEVGGPEVAGDTTWLTAVKPFGTPEEGTSVLSELTGPDGALGDLELSRETSFGANKLAFSGTADLSDGLEAFGDDGLAELLEGQTLGESPEEMEQRYGQPLNEMYRLDVHVLLPGDVEEGWSPALGGEPMAMEASTTQYNVPALALASIAGLCLVLLLGLLLVRLLMRS